jgi:uncharacterized membrane protein YdbT with pleckstrin-like domain
VALVILPIAFVLGFALADPRRATRAVLLAGLAVLAALAIAAIAGATVSPWEALVLAVCLAPGVLLARLAARIRAR